MKALFIGRFQPFHNGHLKVIQEGITDFSFLYIGVGSSQYEHTLENPFSYTERKTMIEVALNEQQRSQIQIIPIPDIHDPPRWVQHVRTIIDDFDIVISNNSFTAQLFKEQGYRIKQTVLFNRNILSGKEIRKRMILDLPWQTLVPEPVTAYLSSIEAVYRLKNINDEQ